MNRLFAFIIFCLLSSRLIAQVTPINVGESRSIYSKILGENRKVNVYLPEGFKVADTTRYPVIYLLDGGMDEDFLHVAGLVQFDSFDWIKRVPKSIVVGVVNIDRQRDFTYPTTIAKHQKAYPKAGHSENFRAFIEKELQPFIEKTYPTVPVKTLIGESLGGLLAAEILLKQPGLFNNYIIISPSIWWDNGSLLTWKTPTITKPTHIYIGVGMEGPTPGDNPRVMETDAEKLAQKLKSTKNPNLQVRFDYLPDEDHATIGHPALYNAFKWIFKKEK